MTTSQSMASDLIDLQDHVRDCDQRWDDLINEVGEHRLKEAINDMSGGQFLSYSQEQDGDNASIANAKEKVGKSLQRVNQSAARIIQTAYTTLDGLTERHARASRLLKQARERQDNDNAVSLKSLDEVHYKGQLTPRAIADGLGATQRTYKKVIDAYINRSITIQRIVLSLDRRSVSAIKNRDEKQANDMIADMQPKAVQAVQSQLKRAASQFKESNASEISGGHYLQGPDREDDNLKLVVASAKEDRDIPRSDTLETPNVNSLEKVLDRTGELIRLMESQREDCQKMINQSRETLKQAREVVNQLGQSKPLDRMISSRDVKFLHNQVKGNTVVQLARAQRHQMKLIKASLEYIESAVKAYGISTV